MNPDTKFSVFVREHVLLVALNLVGFVHLARDCPATVNLRPLEIDLPYFLGMWCTNREKRPYHHNKHETAQKKNYGSFVMAIHGPLSPQMVVSSGFDR